MTIYEQAATVALARINDICGWCGKNLKPQPDVSWRNLTTTEGIACAANYCPQNRAERLDPALRGHKSKCWLAGHENMPQVAARLRKYRRILREQEEK